MKKLLEYLPFHFILCLIFGIIIQFYTKIWSYDFILFNVTILLILIILYALKRKNTRKSFSIATLLFFIVIGIYITFANNPKNYANFYYNHFSSNSSATLVIKKTLKSTKYYHKFITEVTQINSKKTTGNVLLNIKRDSISPLLKIDDRIFITSQFKNIPPSLNPYQFNYNNYLAQQYIYHQVFISKNEYKFLSKKHISINGISEKFRNKIQISLKKQHFNPDELAVINALLLGQRQNISKKLLDSYTKAGAIHILAISGLHIAVIFFILSTLFTPLELIKHGSLIKTVFIIILLWMFAFIAGLSASVVRAVTMFTFVAIGESFKKKKITEYSLISSMFFLLLLKPLFLFDLGFQLSYLAVFGIIWIQPVLFNLWKSKFWLFNKFWNLLTVSVAAQIGVLPISLFYFHQFPSLFILSNLIIIPCLASILIGGILVILLSLSNTSRNFFIDSYAFVISKMNKIINWISNQEQFLFQEVSMSFYEMILWYLIIIFSYQVIIHKKAKHFIYALVIILIFQTNLIYEKYYRQTKQEIIIFQTRKKNLLGIRNGKKLQIIQPLDTLNEYAKKIIRNYRTNENIKTTYIKKTSTPFKFKSVNILIIDSLRVYKIQIKTPIIILQNSPKVNLVRLINTLNPKLIIADGSNYKSYINRWKATCKNKKTPFHSTSENGAYIID